MERVAEPTRRLETGAGKLTESQQDVTGSLLLAKRRYRRRLAAAPSFDSDRLHQCRLVRSG